MSNICFSILNICFSNKITKCQSSLRGQYCGWLCQLCGKNIYVTTFIFIYTQPVYRFLFICMYVHSFDMLDVPEHDSPSCAHAQAQVTATVCQNIQKQCI